MIVVGFLAGCGLGAESPGSASSSPASSVAEGAAPDGERTVDVPAVSANEALTRARRVALVMAGDSTVVEGAPGTPFTRTEFKVEQLLKGTLGDTFTLQVIGGRLAGVTVDSPVPAFAKGHRFILLLGDDGPVGPSINPRAIYEVSRVGSVDVVRPDVMGIPILAAGTTDPAKPTSTGQRLDDVIFSIKQFLKS